MRALSLLKADQSNPHTAHQRMKRVNARRRPGWPVLAVLSWTLAALGVYGIEKAFHPSLGYSATQLAWAKVALIVAAATVFTRVARGVALDAAVATGLAWLVFSIAADAITGLRSSGGGAYRLLGDSLAPRRLQDLTMLAWLAAPALFARRAGGSDRTDPFQR